MEQSSAMYQTYLRILREELVTAMGCTEPIAIAYGAALAAETLGARPEKVLISASGNIIKNVKSVVVPNTGGLKGIEVSAAAGIIAGHPERKLEVLESLDDDGRAQMLAYLEKADIEVRQSGGNCPFELDITVYAAGHEAHIRIVEAHTNVVLIEKDGKVLKGIRRRQSAPAQTDRAAGCASTCQEGEQGCVQQAEMHETDPAADGTQEPEASGLEIRDILDFAETACLDDVKELLDRQIAYNTAIAEEGLRGNYGANVGKVLLELYGDDIKIRARAKAAAGSDARMDGCGMPVVINSGSGNQGITVSVPVVEYAKELGANQEKLYRALLVSNLVSVHLKEGIGRLSAYCGAVTAGCAAGCGIAWLKGADYDAICATIDNTLGNVSGIICDGAKASCAAKISSSIDAALLGYHMYLCGEKFRGGDGIVKDEIEKTIEGVGKIGRIGMRGTDREVLEVMLAK